MKSIAGLAILTMLISGCATARVAGSCPPLSPPPAAAVEALHGAQDSAVDAWVIDLANHYDKLDVCFGR